MKNLAKYVKKSAPKLDCIQTSVFIETRQKNFVTENNLNLSEMVRDMLASAMTKQTEGKRAV